MEWEYMIQRLITDQPDLEEKLDELGKDRWEMTGTGEVTTCISTTHKILLLFFKRPKRETPAPPAEVQKPGHIADKLGVPRSWFRDPPADGGTRGIWNPEIDDPTG